MGLKIPPKLPKKRFILPFPKRTASLHLNMDGLGVGRLLSFHFLGALPIFIRYVSFREGTVEKQKFVQTINKP